MKRTTIILLRTLVVLAGAGVLAFLLWEPQVEGRNAHATLFEIYFKDPFLAYAYLGSIPFFTAVFQAFKALGYAGQDAASRQAAVRPLRIIKYCATYTIGFVAAGEVFLLLGSSDDRAGGVFMGVLISAAALAAAAAASRLERGISKTGGN